MGIGGRGGIFSGVDDDEGMGTGGTWVTGVERDNSAKLEELKG